MLSELPTSSQNSQKKDLNVDLSAAGFSWSRGSALHTWETFFWLLLGVSEIGAGILNFVKPKQKLGKGFAVKVM